MSEVILQFTNQPMRNGLKWSKLEYNWLRRYLLQGLPLDRICELMGRSESSVISKLSSMGFIAYDRSTHSQRWTFQSGRFGKVELLPKEDTSLILSLSDAQSIYKLCKGLEDVKLSAGTDVNSV